MIFPSLFQKKYQFYPMYTSILNDSSLYIIIPMVDR